MALLVEALRDQHRDLQLARRQHFGRGRVRVRLVGADGVAPLAQRHRADDPDARPLPPTLSRDDEANLPLDGELGDRPSCACTCPGMRAIMRRPRRGSIGQKCVNDGATMSRARNDGASDMPSPNAALRPRHERRGREGEDRQGLGGLVRRARQGGRGASSGIRRSRDCCTRSTACPAGGARW